MRRPLLTIVSAVAVIVLGTNQGRTAELSKGIAAQQNGDFATALREYLPLAKQGVAIAQHNLGVMYQNGEGVAHDYEEAAAWFERAANQGLASSQTNLGILYTKGLGVAQDPEKAFEWTRRAALQGDPRGQYNLSLIYTRGHGIPYDVRRAYFWAHIAAVNGNGRGRRLTTHLSHSLTSAQISEIEEQSDECLQSNYTNC